MAFDFEKQHLTPDPHEIPDAHVITMAFEMEPGDIMYCDADEIVIDLTPERRPWISKYIKVYDEGEIVEYGAVFDDEDQLSLARLIRTNEGLVVDRSHEDKRSWASLDERLPRPIEALSIPEQSEHLLPIIYMAHNEDELSFIEPDLVARDNIVLEGSEVRPLLDAIEELKDELLDDAVELAEDDAEEYEEEASASDDGDDEELV